MDIDRITDIVHALSATPSRRRVSQSLAGLTAGTVLAPLIAPIAGEAKKKRKQKKRGRCYSYWSCGIGELCKGGQCKPGCDPRFKDDCPAGQRCNLAIGQCAPECEPGDTCTVEGHVCNGGWGAPPCSSDADCDSPRWGGLIGRCDPELHACYGSYD